jgi:hypothetical protein
MTNNINDIVMNADSMIGQEASKSVERGSC